MAAMSAGRERRVGQRLPGHVELRRPDRLGIVLDQARAGQDLLELLLGRRDHPAVAVEDDRPARRRALIQGEDVLLHERRLREIDELDRIFPGI